MVREACQPVNFVAASASQNEASPLSWRRAASATASGSEDQERFLELPTEQPPLMLHDGTAILGTFESAIILCERAEEAPAF